MNSTRIIKFLVPITSLFIFGCGSATFESWNTSMFRMSYWNDSVHERKALDTQQSIEASLAINNVEKAQRLLLASRRDNIEEKLLSNLYTEVGNRLIQEAEHAAIERRPERAGRLFRMTVDIYPEDTQLKATIRLSRGELNAKIEQCADDLMQKGLIAYRSGELDQAVLVWEEIGQFHPNHAPSLIAISTTKRQLKNLEILTSKHSS